MIGSRESESQETAARVLNRIIRRTENGWEYEPDQRHTDMIVGALDLEDAKGVSTPGEDEKGWEEEENRVLLDPIQSTTYRTVAARCNYLAQDRVDIMYATKEICRKMANPDSGSWKG